MSIDEFIGCWKQHSPQVETAQQSRQLIARLLEQLYESERKVIEVEFFNSYWSSLLDAGGRGNTSVSPEDNQNAATSDASEDHIFYVQGSHPLR